MRSKVNKVPDKKERRTSLPPQAATFPLCAYCFEHQLHLSLFFFFGKYILFLNKYILTAVSPPTTPPKSPLTYPHLQDCPLQFSSFPSEKSRSPRDNSRAWQDKIQSDKAKAITLKPDKVTQEDSQRMGKELEIYLLPLLGVPTKRQANSYSI